MKTPRKGRSLGHTPSRSRSLPASPV